MSVTDSQIWLILQAVNLGGDIFVQVAVVWLLWPALRAWLRGDA